MRLLWLTDDHLPHRGGSRIVYHNICSNIEGERPCLVTRWIDGCGRFDAECGYRIKRVRVPFLKAASALGAEEMTLYAPLLLACIAEVMKKRPDILHCGEPLASGLVGYAAGRLFGIPYVVWLHDNPFGQVSRLRHPLKRFLCSRAAGIATSCGYARDAVIAEGYDPGRVGLVHPGVDTAVFRPSGGGERVRRRFGLEGKKVLLTVSRLLPQKGQDTLIRVLPLLAAAHPEIVYLVGGEGPHRGALEALSRAVGVSDRVIFAGFIPQEELPRYYNSCDLFVMLNRDVGGLSWEGFGIVLLEASACGKPVIGGRAGGVKDSVIDGVTGFLVSTDDEGEIVRRIDTLLTDAGLAGRMGAAGAERARRSFSWKESARKTMAFSEAVAAAARGRG